MLADCLNAILAQFAGITSIDSSQTVGAKEKNILVRHQAERSTFSAFGVKAKDAA
jgi:hypothetical protein